MNQEEARKITLESLEYNSLIAVIGMNSDRIANSLYNSKLESMPKTILEMGDNHGESPETFLIALLYNLLQKAKNQCNIGGDSFLHVCGTAERGINEISKALVTDKNDCWASNYLSITQRKMSLYDNFNMVIENLRRLYSAKDFLILMNISCDTELTPQSLKMLRTISENSNIKIILFIEMTPNYYNLIREAKHLEGLVDLEIYEERECSHGYQDFDRSYT